MFAKPEHPCSFANLSQLESFRTAQSMISPAISIFESGGNL